jgi:hypothetical protein
VTRLVTTLRYGFSVFNRWFAASERVTRRQRSNKMTEAEFWRIVGYLRWRKDGAPASTAPVCDALAELPTREIFLFAEFLAWKLYLLDTREHARHFGVGSLKRDGGPFSTDGFLYCRAMAVARGQAEYERVVADPTRMPDTGFESLLYVPSRAFEWKTEQEWTYQTGVSYEALSNKAGWLKLPEDAEHGDPSDRAKDPRARGRRPRRRT